MVRLRTIRYWKQLFRNRSINLPVRYVNLNRDHGGTILSKYVARHPTVRRIFRNCQKLHPIGSDVLNRRLTGESDAKVSRKPGLRRRTAPTDPDEIISQIAHCDPLHSSHPPRGDRGLNRSYCHRSRTHRPRHADDQLMDRHQEHQALAGR